LLRVSRPFRGKPRRVAANRAGGPLRPAFWALAFVALSAPRGLATDCRQSPILFAHGGSVFAAYPGKQPTRAAAGLTAPHDLAWAPGCEHYAFIDDSSLWVGELRGRPAKVPIPGAILGYAWSPDGTALALTDERPACLGNAAASEGPDAPSDVLTLRLPGLAGQALSHDCRTRFVGWSSDATRVLLARRVTYSLPCETARPPCAEEDLLIWDSRSRSARAGIRASQLNRLHVEIDRVVRWDAAREVLYAWSLNIQIGGYGNLLAISTTSGEILWHFPCERADALANGLFGVQRKLWVDSVEANEWQRVLLGPNGVAVRQYPVAPDEFDWSGPAGLLFAADVERDPTPVKFIAESGEEVWRYKLPEHFRATQTVWTPGGGLVVTAYEGRRYPIPESMGMRWLDLAVWLLDPQRRVGSKIFEGDTPESDETMSLLEGRGDSPAAALDMLAGGGTVFLAGGHVWHIIPPLVVATWAHPQLRP